MQLQFKAKDRQAQTLRKWALDRTGFVLRRMTWQVSQASVSLIDLDGPRRGVDKRCQVAIVASDGSPVVVTATARDWRSALNQALSRAAEVLRRLFNRVKDGRREQRVFIRQERVSASGLGQA